MAGKSMAGKAWLQEYGCNQTLKTNHKAITTKVWLLKYGCNQTLQTNHKAKLNAGKPIKKRLGAGTRPMGIDSHTIKRDDLNQSQLRVLTGTSYQKEATRVHATNG